jgi:hypothetical protein
MAIKNSNIKPESALSVVSSLDADVYLGGSRYMAEKYDFAVSPDTDYDFYTEMCSETVDALLAGGFTSLRVDEDENVCGTATEDYDDYNDNGVAGVFQRDNVQVLLRNNAYEYSMIFDCLSEDAYRTLVWKSSPISVFQKYNISDHDRKVMLSLLFNTMAEVADKFSSMDKSDDNTTAASDGWFEPPKPTGKKAVGGSDDSITAPPETRIWKEYWSVLNASHKR